MDAERGFQVVLLAITGLLSFLLLLPYLTEILGAILLAYLLSSPYNWLAPRIGDRLAAIGLIVVTLIAFLIPFVLLLTVVVDGVDDLLNSLGQDGNLGDFDGVQSLLESVFGTEVESTDSLLDLVQEGDVLNLAQTALDAFGGVSDAFIRLTILLFIWYYLLKDGDRLVAWVGETMPLSDRLQDDLFTRADKLMHVVVIGNFIVAVADGLLVTVGLFIVGFGDIVFWAFISVFLALIPLVGTMLIWVPAAAYLLYIGEVGLGVFLLVWGFLVVGSVDHVLRPFLGAPEVGLEPAIFIVGVLTGLTLFGVMGVFYGPVLLVMTKVVYDSAGQEIKASG